MTEVVTNKDHLHKHGFCVIRNLLNDKEVERYRSAIQKITDKNKIDQSRDLYNFPETWEYIVNDRLLNI